MALSVVRKMLNKREDTDFADDDSLLGNVVDWIDTGSFVLNAAISGRIHGGMPSNKILGLAGEAATGKTFYALEIASNWLKQNPDGTIIVFDTENAITKDTLTQRKIDPSKVAILYPETVEEFRTKALEILDEYAKIDADIRKKEPIFMILDSLGNLSTTKEQIDSLSGKPVRDMTRAQVLRGAFRTITLKIAKLNVGMIVNSHVYAVIGAYVPTNVVSGGGGLKYAASTILFLSKKKEKDTKTNEHLGSHITVTVDKSRFTREGTKTHTLLKFDGGLDRYYGLFEIAEKHGIFRKKAKGHEMPDGSTAYEHDILRFPEKYFTDDVMKRLEIACEKEFQFGKESDEIEIIDGVVVTENVAATPEEI